MISYKQEIDTRIIILCGGMIDVLAGKTKISPPIIKRLGLASFYRVFQEPRRLIISRLNIYIFTFFSFISKVLWMKITGRDLNIIDHFSAKRRR